MQNLAHKVNKKIRLVPRKTGKTVGMRAVHTYLYQETYLFLSLDFDAYVQANSS
jgi:hypothetical protein